MTTRSARNVLFGCGLSMLALAGCGGSDDPVSPAPNPVPAPYRPNSRPDPGARTHAHAARDHDPARQCHRHGGTNGHVRDCRQRHRHNLPVASSRRRSRRCQRRELHHDSHSDRRQRRDLQRAPVHRTASEQCLCRQCQCRTHRQPDRAQRRPACRYTRHHGQRRRHGRCRALQHGELRDHEPGHRDDLHRRRRQQHSARSNPCRRGQHSGRNRRRVRLRRWDGRRRPLQPSRRVALDAAATCSSATGTTS